MKSTKNLGVGTFRLLTVAATLLHFQCHAGLHPVAGNYDGVNYLTCALYSVGTFFGNTYSEGAKFHVNGTGNIKLKRLTMPLINYAGVASAENYRLSIVRDAQGPAETIIWAGRPEGVGPPMANYSFAISGWLEGGQDYWLLFEPIAFDGGSSYAWPFASPPLLNCGQGVPPDSGDVAERVSSASTGVPSGSWFIWRRDIRPAFLIEGNHPPEASIVVSPLLEFPNLTNLIVISPNNRNAKLVLDGSGSEDLDDDALQFAWLDRTNLLVTTMLTTNVLRLGTHTITLVVDDGSDSATASVKLKVITPGEAVRALITIVAQTNVGNKPKHSLIALLLGAQEFFNRGRMAFGDFELRKFQHRVSAPIANLDGDDALLLFRVAQEIIDRTTEFPTENEDRRENCQ